VHWVLEKQMFCDHFFVCCFKTRVVSRYFLLLMRYVPNVYEIGVISRTDRRPTSVPERAFLEELQMAISPLQCQINAWSQWTTHRKLTAGSRIVM